jgi:hypothetical protein
LPNQAAIAAARPGGNIPRMTPGDLRAWQKKHGLTVAEMAWIFRRSERTIYRKLSGEVRLTVIPSVIEAYEVLLAFGMRPPRWPADLLPHPTEIRRRQRRRVFVPNPLLVASEIVVDPLAPAERLAQ